MWTRNDTLGFAFFAVLLLACFLYKEKRWKEVGIYAAIVWSPLIIWNLYLALKIKMSAGARFQLSHLFDFQKLKEMILFVVSYLSWYSPFGNNSGLELYGLAFLVPLIFAVFNYKKFKQDQPFIVFYILGSFAVYFLLFLLLDEKTQNASITNLMDSSFKRGLFCFMPLFIYYAANTSFSKKLFEKIEDFRLAKNV
jgi:hypothetical protein